MSLIQGFILLACSPVLVWSVAVLASVGRRTFRRRGDEAHRQRRLAKLFSAREVVVIPTGDINLSEKQVREIGASRGYRLLGYERGNGPLRRRCGVFLRNGGTVDALASASEAAEQNRRGAGS